MTATVKEKCRTLVDFEKRGREKLGGWMAMRLVKFLDDESEKAIEKGISLEKHLIAEGKMEYKDSSSEGDDNFSEEYAKALGLKHHKKWW